MLGQYSRINFLVHPLYYPFFGLDLLAEDFDQYSYNRVLSKLLGTYGKSIIDAKTDPGIYFVLVLPAYERIFGELQNSKVAVEKYKIFEAKVLIPFLNFAKSLLGDRLYITNYDYNHINTTQLLLPKNFENLFKSKVKVLAFGEYADYCVSAWSRRLFELLKRKGIRAHFEYRPDLSLPYYEEHKNRYIQDSLWNRFAKARDRRKLLRTIAKNQQLQLKA